MRASALPSAPPSAASTDAFEALVLAHHGPIYRYLRRMTGRTSEAEDLAQDTFLRAYRAFVGLPQDTNHRAWLYTIATNAYRNHVRAERRRKSAHATVRVIRHGLGHENPEAETLAGETRSALDTAIRGLPLKQRAAFTMRKLEELDYETIGDCLECSTESARAHVFQATRKIRAIVDSKLGGRARRSS